MGIFVDRKLQSASVHKKTLHMCNNKILYQCKWHILIIYRAYKRVRVSVVCVWRRTGEIAAAARTPRGSINNVSVGVR